MADNDAPAPPPPHDNTPPISEKEDLSLPPPEPAAPCAHPEQVTEDDSASSGMADKEELTLPPAPVTAVTVTVTESELLQEELPTQENLVAVEAEKPNLKEEPELKQKQKQKLGQALQSFKEESNKVSDLTESEHKALLELSQLVEESMDEFSSSSPEKEKSSPGTSSDEVSIWGIPLLKDDRSDVILLKFLRARDFKVKDAFAMLKNTIHWRRSFLIDSLIDEDLGDDLEKVVFMHEHDKEGHPVCYNVYGEFQNKELYEKTFKDDEKRAKFLRWRVQFLEKSIRKLDFSPGGVNTIFQVSDLKNSPGPGKRELRQATKQSLHVLQDNYPEFVAKQVFINVPWWYLAFYSMITPFLTQRTKSKFVFASPARSAETLFKYISPERVPVQYGGLSVDSCDCNPEFTTSDPATDMIIKPRTKQIVEIIIYEKCVIVWELRVVGWEVSYGAEFVPSTESGYTVIINKIKKMTPTDEPVVHGSFAVSELGKLLLIVDNPTSKKKKLLYRFKVKPLCDGLAGKNAE
ncbi:hypothetical protein SAY87_024632 [Trapa incisa]|uniref:Patellin-3 n=1 Tax=Trapa incisa TaxID=236973 RepID=A0AAN7GPJ2_9MYRT|nr:hypothetical protein SAY87_024632 [Trapa incisa]